MLHAIADVATRWNSSFYAWVRLIKLKGYIQALLAVLINSLEVDAKKDGKALEKIMLTSNEWDLLQELISILGPFEEATQYLGGEKYVTHSIMHPIIKEIKRLLLLSLTSPSPTSPTSPTSPIPPTPPIPTLSTSPTSNLNEILLEIQNADDVFVMIEEVEIQETSTSKKDDQRKNKIDLDKPLETENKLDEVKQNLYHAMGFYWQFLPEDYLLSTILDPRIKCMNEEDENEAEEILRKKYDEYKENYLPTPIESRSTSPIPTEITIYQPKLFNIFKQNQLQQASDEVTEYLKEDKITFNLNPFEWWLSKKSKYPILTKIARIYLAAPATSTPSERLFSDAGNLLSEKRTRMDSELFKRIMFLKRNASKVNSIYN